MSTPATEAPNILRDFPAFARSLLKIKTKDRRIVPLALNGEQEIIWEAIKSQLDQQEPIRIAILKPRQVGASTLCQALCWWKITTQENTHALSIAHETKATQRIFAMSQTFFDYMPMKPMRRYSTRQEIVLENQDDYARIDNPGLRSRLDLGTAGKMGTGRAATTHVLHCSEIAQWPYPEDLIGGLFPSVPYEPDTMILMESTANGAGEFWHEFWQECKSGENQFIPVFVPWFNVKDYLLSPAVTARWMVKRGYDDEEKRLRRIFKINDERLAWRRMRINELKGDEDLFRQEYPCVVASTFVSTSAGIHPISQCHNPLVTESGAIERLIERSPAPIFRLTTTAGRSLTGTGEHRLERTDGTFVELKDASGEWLTLRLPRFAFAQHVVEWTEPPQTTHRIIIDERWGRFLGYFMGDGCYSGYDRQKRTGTVSIACDARDTDVVADVATVMESLFGGVRQRKTSKGGIELRRGCQAFQSVMENLGIWKKNSPHRKVCVPDAILRSPQSVVREFLRGLFEADGHAAYGDGGAMLFSKHRDFLEQLQLLLLGFGITSRVSSHDRRTGDHHYVANELTMTLEESRHFHSEIGFIGARKRARSVQQGSRFGRQRRPMRLADQVVSIEPVGVAPVYDLMLAGPVHTYCTNGLISHNCDDVEAWIVSGNPVFDTHRLLTALEKCRKPHLGYLDPNLAWRPDKRGPVSMWRHPVAEQRYTIGVDVALGVRGGDYSVVEVVDAHDEQCAEWHGHIDPISFAGEIEKLGRYYNDAVVAIEVQNQGFSTQAELRKRYWNLYRWRYMDRFADRMTDKIGWETNLKTKPLLIAHMAHLIREGDIGIRNKELVQEMMRFIETPSGGEAAAGCHDDRVMAFMIAVWVNDVERPKGDGGSVTMPYEHNPPQSADADYALSHDLGQHLFRTDDEADWRTL